MISLGLRLTGEARTHRLTASQIVRKSIESIVQPGEEGLLGWSMMEVGVAGGATRPFTILEEIICSSEVWEARDL